MFMAFDRFSILPPPPPPATSSASSTPMDLSMLVGVIDVGGVVLSIEVSGAAILLKPLMKRREKLAKPGKTWMSCTDCGSGQVLTPFRSSHPPFVFPAQRPTIRAIKPRPGGNDIFSDWQKGHIFGADLGPSIRPPLVAGLGLRYRSEDRPNTR